MTCPYYMGPSCGLRCCMTRAEQFAFFEINEPSFAEFCPMVQRYGEASHARDTGAGNSYAVP